MAKANAFIILTPGFAANNQDTIITSLQFFVKEFRVQYPGISLHIITFQYPLFVGDYHWNGTEVHAIGGRNRKGFQRLLTWVRAFRVFIKLRSKYEVTGILSIWINECAVFGQLLSRLYKIKQISWVSGQDAKPSNKFLKLLKIDSENVVFKSQNLVKELGKSRRVKNPIIIPSGIDPVFLGNIPKGERKYDLIGVGSLIELKDFSLFIELVDELVIEYPDMKTIIIGTGPQKQFLEAMITAKNLPANVSLVGELTYPDTIGMMKKSKILLHTSMYEGQGMVLLEALFCGLEVVCFDVGFNDPKVMHVSKDRLEMKQNLSRLLSDKKLIHQPVILKTMSETVTEMATLFGLKQ